MMTPRVQLLLGIDIGTTSTKAVLLDPAVGIVATASAPVTLFSPEVGWAEADPSVWWANVVTLVPKLLAQARCVAADVGAIATSGMVPAVVVLDNRDRPLRRAILQNDARAVQEIHEVAERTVGLDLVAMTGSALTQQSVAPTLRWIARHEPEIFMEIRAVVGSYDWILMAMGAAAHVEQNWAMESGFFTLNGQRIEAMVSAAGISDGLLRPVQPPGSVVGELSSSAAAELGLRPGTPLFVGGADHVLSAFAAGLDEPGDWLVKLGGGGDILVVSDHPLVDARLYLDAHPAKDLWLPNGCMSTSGSLVRWLAALTGTTDLIALGDVAATRPPGEVLCLPYFLGEKSPLHDPNLRGAFVGLDLAHDAATLFRSVLEAVAFGFRHHVEIFEELGVTLAAEPRLTNGGSGSPIWMQIHADVLGRSVVPVLGHPGASLGAALSAGVGVGALEGWGVSGDYVSVGSPVDPDPARARRYDDLYACWRDLGRTVTPFSHYLALTPNLELT